MSSVADRTHIEITVLELVALLDATGDGAGVARTAFPIVRLDPEGVHAQAAAVLLAVRRDRGPAGLGVVIENVVAVMASAVSIIELRVLGSVDRTVLYAIGPEWTADLILGEDGNCALGLLLTSHVAGALRRDHLSFDASLDLTLSIRGEAGPVNLVFDEGVLANARGEKVSIRGSGVSPTQFGDVFEAAIAGYLA